MLYQLYDLASPDFKLQYCAGLPIHIVLFRACQKEDWKHPEQICKLLIVGHGDMQVQTPIGSDLLSLKKNN
jgi:hypothetical protein